MHVVDRVPRSSLQLHQDGLHLLCLQFCASVVLGTVTAGLVLSRHCCRTSVRKSAVMSRSSLWQIDGRPPQAQFSACSTEKGFPHTQLVGRFDGCQPYLRHRTSRKTPLWRANPCSAIGKVDSQLEAPFSLETLRALCRVVGSLPISSDALCASCYRRIVRASDLAFLCSP